MLPINLKRLASAAAILLLLGATLCSLYYDRADSRNRSVSGNVRSSRVTSPQGVPLPRRAAASEKGGKEDTFRCCGGQKHHQLLLACEDTQTSHIAGVPLALAVAPANSSEEQAIALRCGAERPKTCATNVREAVAAACTGRRSCEVDLESVLEQMNASSSCGGNLDTLHVRWVCSSTVVSSRAPVSGAHAATDAANSEADLYAAATLPPLPLSANGSRIVDANGSRVRFHGVSWGGFHIVNAPGGLNVAPLESLAKMVRRLKFNVVRLTVSVHAILLNPPVEERRVAANPRLFHAKALDVLDATIRALDDEGVMVWLDMHMLDSDWCCNQNDGNGLWFNDNFSEDDYRQALVDLAKRYKTQKNVVGLGLKNEPRQVCSTRANGQQVKLTDWLALEAKYEGKEKDVTTFVEGNHSEDFAEMVEETSNNDECLWPSWASGEERLRYRDFLNRAGPAVLAESPHWLLGVNGLFYGQYLDEVLQEPLDLPKTNVVFEAHEYKWYTQSSLLNESMPFDKALKAYGDNLNKNWGYLSKGDHAPIFVSEFGMSHTWENEEDSRRWFQLFHEYAVGDVSPAAEIGGLDWAYWQLSGVQAGGTGRREGEDETFGVLNRCWTAPWNSKHYDALKGLGLR
mmetsp:Transcript_65718/g.137377  ORF Transcript_65718/g.137377 Transcript_65718/m.137377 type:complete len:630 (+) Transcript_65718:81-1970(+)